MSSATQGHKRWCVLSTIRYALGRPWILKQDQGPQITTLWLALFGEVLDYCNGIEANPARNPYAAKGIL